VYVVRADDTVTVRQVKVKQAETTRKAAVEERAQTPAEIVCQPAALAGYVKAST